MSPVAIDKKSLGGMEYFLPSELRPYLGSMESVLGAFLSDARRARFQEVLKSRSRMVASVFEDTHHTHNISAVLRTHDAIGYQDVFFVYHRDNMTNRLKDSVERGSSRWLSVRRFLDVPTCASILRSSGYKIALVSLPSFEKTTTHFVNELPQFSCREFASSRFVDFVGDSRIALIFGNEALGVSPLWNRFADMYVHVPMTGFVESLNVSVCAALLLNALRTQFENRELLTDVEKNLTYEHWIAGDTSDAYLLLQRLNPELTPYYQYVKTGAFFSPSISASDVVNMR